METSSLATKQHCVVVGGGPAGLMAAEIVARQGHRVTLLERMGQTGRKFLMAGRGGLNLTHSEPLDLLLARYQSGPWLDAAIRDFSPDALRAFATDLGQPSFVGSSGRVFPQAMKSSPMLRAWLTRLGTLGVNVQIRHDVVGLDANLVLHCRMSDGTARQIAADAVVLAMGGASWPKLGANGNFIALLQSHGVDMAPLEAANCGLLLAWSVLFSSRFAGSVLKNITLQAGETKVRGEIVITATGLEGGPVYALGPSLRAALRDHAPYPLILDLRPDLSLTQLTERLTRTSSKATTANMLRKAGFSPLAQALLRETTGSLLTLPAATLAALAKQVPLNVIAMAGLEKAISTAGGVKSAAFNDDLMLNALPGVFVAGEMLDWDAPTGGYLLQACFATGNKAGQSAARWLNARVQPLA